MVQVLIPSQLTSYTDGATRVPAAGGTVGAVLDDLDARFPGLLDAVLGADPRSRSRRSPARTS